LHKLPANTGAHEYTDKYTKNGGNVGHRTITISDEAYMILSRLKREKESFTDIIKRVFNEPRPMNTSPATLAK